MPRALRHLPDEIFELFPVLRDMLGRRGGDLSGGQQQQLAIDQGNRAALQLQHQPVVAAAAEQEGRGQEGHGRQAVAVEHPGDLRTILAVVQQRGIEQQAHQHGRHDQCGNPAQGCKVKATMDPCQRRQHGGQRHREPCLAQDHGGRQGQCGADRHRIDRQRASAVLPAMALDMARPQKDEHGEQQRHGG